MGAIDGKAKKLRGLKAAVDEGMADVEAGRVVPWNLEDFLKQARMQFKSLHRDH